MKETKDGAWGFIVWDHTGTGILAGAGHLGPVHDALLAETLACKHALEAAEHFGISRVAIETDSVQLREALSSLSRDLSVGGGLFKDLRNLLYDSFVYSDIYNIPRTCNEVAHELAATSMTWDPGQYQVWTEPLPECVSSLLARDLAMQDSVNAMP